MRNDRIKVVYKRMLKEHFDSLRSENTDYNEFVDYGDTILLMRIYLDQSLRDWEVLAYVGSFVKKLAEYIEGDVLKVNVDVEFEGCARTNGNHNELKVVMELHYDGTLLSDIANE